MTRNRSQRANVAVRIRGVVVGLALSVLALHVVAGAASAHVHGVEDEVCSVCATFAGEDDAVQPRQGLLLATQGDAGAPPASTALLAVLPLPYDSRGPPTLFR